MSKVWTSKYGTKIDISGLTPEQVKQVQNKAQGSGAYGSAATQLANQLRSGAGAAAGGGGKKGGGGKTKNIGSATDSLGNQTTVSKDAKGNPVIEQTGGESHNALKALLDSYLKGDGLKDAPDVLTSDDLLSTRQQVQDSLYQESTKYLDRDMAMEKEAITQELADRGVPFDAADPDSAWGRPMRSLDEKYRGLKDSALNQARAGADARMATQAGVNKTAFDAFMEKYFAPADAAGKTVASIGGTAPDPTSIINLIGSMSESELAKYGIDKDFAAKMKAVSGARGSVGGGESTPIIGGNAPGFNV